MDQNIQIQLYHELLNSYVYFFNQNHPDVRLRRNEKTKHLFYFIFRLMSLY
jgi:hypothetical protein